MSIDLKVAAKHWSSTTLKSSHSRWWQSNTIVQHINQNICGKRVSGTEGGDIELIKTILNGRTLACAVSVGCGNAYHEFKLIESGIVERFELYEISETRAEAVIKSAQLKGLQNQVNIKLVDAFTEPVYPKYDLVYWKDSLHHMESSYKAVRWSRSVLNPQGLFFMNDFVGPTYMQYSNRQLDMAEKVREILPKKYLIDPNGNGENLLSFRRSSPDIEKLKAIDPTECADSSNILGAVFNYFPSATLIRTGGVIYSLALSDVLANFDEEEDQTLLKALLVADDFCVEAGETLYAVVFAVV